MKPHYVDQTKRKFKIRIKTLKKLLDSMSVVSCHQIDNEHKLDWENVIILDSEQSLYKRRISEI